MANLVTAAFDSLPPADFLTQAQLIVTSMTGNTNFPEPWPAPVPSLTTIAADMSAYQDVLNATVAGDKTRITARSSARDRLSSDLQLLRLYVEMMGYGDPTRIATSGFPLNQRAPRSAAVLLSAPNQFKLEQGPVSGMLVARARRMKAAGSYEVQLATADPTLEASWSQAGVYTSCRNIPIEGLVPGKTYSVRLRAIGAAGPGAWTSASSMMVI
jgi:hypothetical protein